jgi:hypothetical protein
MALRDRIYEIDLTKPQEREVGLPDEDLLALRTCCQEAVPPFTRDRGIWKRHLLSNGRCVNDLRPLIWDMKDQTGPSCTSNQTVQGMQVARELACLPRVSLSAASLFDFVGGPGGSSVTANLTRLTKYGCVPESVWPANKIYGPVPAGYESERPKYRMRESIWCNDFDEATWRLMSAHPIGFGVNWGGGGHSILGVCVVFDAAKDRWGWEICNSWGEDWGDKGFGVLWESQISAGVRNRYGAVAYTSPVFYHLAA